MKLPESVTKLLENSLSKHLTEDEKKDFKKNSIKYLVSLLLVIEENLEEYPISAMLYSTVEEALYDDNLEAAQKILEEKEIVLSKKSASKK